MAQIAPRPTRRTRARLGDQPKPSIEDRLLAAMERLLDQGHRFAALSVEQLTGEAGIARGTFYLHFRDKGELVARLMSQVTEEIIASTGTWMSDAHAARPPELQQALVGMVATFKKHQAILAAVNDTAPYDQTVASLYKTMVDRICAQSRVSLGIIQNKGLSRPGATDDVAEVLSWMIVMYCARFVGERNGPDLARLAESLGYISASTAFADGA
ncbi:MAG: TetR/AcrR family transcriptional regulator [Nevskia sp.]|jgi:TetR/AcrR family transcriptional regulator, ethionamide resistance regulator|nr:TetR/AcrR family transcriptional regulator [Gammaproteobacteria bacterium]MDH4458521.1 TetR/AcrR family transcriptional regulator [Nevskia sp.]